MPRKKNQRQALAELLTEVLIELPRILKRPMSQNGVAHSLGVDSTSFSQWMTENRIPTGDNIYVLGEGLAEYNKEGARSYWKLMEIPEPIPPDLEEFVNWWQTIATSTDKKKILGIVEKDIHNDTTKGTEPIQEPA